MWHRILAEDSLTWWAPPSRCCRWAAGHLSLTGSTLWLLPDAWTAYMLLWVSVSSGSHIKNEIRSTSFVECINVASSVQSTLQSNLRWPGSAKTQPRTRKRNTLTKKVEVYRPREQNTKKKERKKFFCHKMEIKRERAGLALSVSVDSVAVSFVLFFVFLYFFYVSKKISNIYFLFFLLCPRVRYNMYVMYKLWCLGI